MKNFKSFIGIVVVVVILIVGVLYLMQQKNTVTIQNTSTQSTTALRLGKVLYVSDYNVIVELAKGTSSNGATLHLIDSTNGNTRQVFTPISPSIFNNFVWDKQSSRIYFSTTALADDSTVFHMIDLNDPDPNAITEIVYNSSGFMTGKLELIGTNNSIIFFNRNDQVYSLNIDEGLAATPILIK